MENGERTHHPCRYTNISSCNFNINNVYSKKMKKIQKSGFKVGMNPFLEVNWFTVSEHDTGHVKVM